MSAATSTREEALSVLIDSLPPGTVLTADADLQRFRRDRALDPQAGTPIAAVLARSTSDVRQAVGWAAANRVAVVPRGAGTGLSGGATAQDGCLVISTERMRDLTINPATRIAVVQPGMLNVELKAAAAHLGLWYPPDPASFEICTIGGNVATNAGGLCCVKYGVTVDYVLGLEVVLSDGTAVHLGGPRLKDVAGLPLVKLFVGSEGTLGIVTEVTLRLLPKQPAQRTVAAWYSTTEDAASAVADVARALRPSMLEYMDRTTVNAVEDMLHTGLDRNAAALVLATTDDHDPDRDEADLIAHALSRHNPIRVERPSVEDGEKLVHARRVAIPAVERLGQLLLEDVGVSVTRLADLIRGVEAVAEENNVTIAFIAHAGDGNSHPLVVFDPEDELMNARAHKAYGEVMTLAINLGGTITGEHGVGRLKRPWLQRQIGEDVLQLSRRIKLALDPLGILNPGTIFAEGEE